MPGDIQFVHPDWSSLPETPDNCECAWTNKEGWVVGLQHFGVDKPLRKKLSDVNAVRDHYRSGFAAQGMGLVDCDLFDLDGVRAVRAIGKMILQPTHAAYAGTIALPLPKESYVLNVAVEETGISGMRDTAILLKMSADLEQRGYALDLPSEEPAAGSPQKPMGWRDPSGALVRWAQDPYQPDYDGPCLRNVADAAEHDPAFPDHPLSQVRATLHCLVQGIKLSADLKKRAQDR